MDHWRAVLPVPIHEVDYEETVADLEGVARRLLAACGLEWDPACLEFHRTSRPVRTASVTQVRQPVYKHSVARWKNYERELADLFAAAAGRRTPEPERPRHQGFSCARPGRGWVLPQWNEWFPKTAMVSHLVVPCPPASTSSVRPPPPASSPFGSWLEELEGRFAPATFNPLPSAVDGTSQSLRNAILTADANGDASNTISLAAGTYSLTDAAAGNLLIQDTAGGVASKTFTLVGQGPSSTIITGGSGWNDRDLPDRQRERGGRHGDDSES